jgi:predicted enzyme related to lactoylglutathione lyase
MPAIRTIVHPVEDLAKAKSLYAALLGTEPYADQPYYVGFRAGEVELGLDPNGHAKGMTGPVGYWEVDDLDGHLQRLVDAGATVRQPVTDVGGGRRIATVADADGNVFGLQQD